MEEFLILLMTNYGDSLVIIVLIAFLYIKVNFLTGTIAEVKEDFKKHLSFHLCQPKEKGE